MRYGCNYPGNDFQYVRGEIESSVYLLPTEPFFAYNVDKARRGTSIVEAAMCDHNLKLQELNVDADSLLSSGIPMKNFVKGNQKTILRVSSPEEPSINTGCNTDQQWPDREVDSRWRPKAGDGTVPIDSAHPVRSLPFFEHIPHEVFGGGKKHLAFPGQKNVVNALADFFWENAAQQL